MSRSRLFLAAALILLALTSVSWDPLSRRVRSAQMLSDLSHAPDQRSDEPLVETDLSLPHAKGVTRARIYRRADVSRGKGVVIAHGVHYAGIDEKRLVPFARTLARAGLVVMTPELRDLADYRITDRGVYEMQAAVRMLSARRDLVSDPHVGLLGFSFAGGLALVAAADPDTSLHLDGVMSIGGHHDLERVLRFFVNDEIETPSGSLPMKAHEYGLVVLLYGNVDAFVPAADRTVLADALRFWLKEDREAAKTRAKDCTTEPCTHLFGLVEQGQLGEIKSKVWTLIEAHRNELRALSPAGRLRSIGVPVSLLHGSADNVIPPTELAWGDRELEGRPHRAVVTPLIEHVEVSKTATLTDKLTLVDFMASLL